MLNFFKKIALTIFIMVGLLYIISLFFSVNNYELPKNYLPFNESKFKQIEGIQLHYREWIPNDSIKGTVVLIHGFSGSTFSWRKNVDSLIHNNYKVVAIDLPAFGYSDKSIRLKKISEPISSIVWKLLDSINVSNVNLVGHSMGGSLIKEMAEIQPQKTKSLFFVDAAFGEMKTGALINFIGRRNLTKRYAEIALKKKFLNYEQFNELLTSAYNQPADSASVIGYMKPFEIKNSAAAILTVMTLKTKKLNKHSISTIPAMMVWGKEDSWIPLSIGEKYAKENPKTTLHTIEKAGHCPMETHPATFNKLLIDFLEKLN